ncbi:MAG: hypothetical protein LUD01_05985, partial [Clostridiales bacterium]|nr:hypothetical protein [Clostridiales bacterium]
YGSCAHVTLQNICGDYLLLNGKAYHLQNLDKEKKTAEFLLQAGRYELICPLPGGMQKQYSRETDIHVLLADDAAREKILQYAPELIMMPPQMLQGSLGDTMVHVFSGRTYPELEQLEKELQTLG